MVIYFYRPNPKTPAWVRLWDRLFKPRFTHCNIQIGKYVIDLGRDAPTVTEQQEALTLRTPTKMFFLPDEVSLASVADMSDIRATELKTTLYVLGWKRPRIYNCASFVSLILQTAWPTFEVCYTPDELDEQLERFNSHSCLHQATPRLAKGQVAASYPKDRGLGA